MKDLHALNILDNALLMLWVSQEVSSSDREERRVKWRQSVAVSFPIDDGDCVRARPLRLGLEGMEVRGKCDVTYL